VYIGATEVEISDLEYERKDWLVADKKKSIFGSDSIVQERERFLAVFVMTVQTAIAVQQDDLECQITRKLHMQTDKV